jgi:CRP-like cAMP-binding protein
MTSVGAQCAFLKASPELRAALHLLGNRQRFSAGQILFREDQEAFGAFLLLKGKVRMSVQSLPKLDRQFSAGSLMGLPSTFTGRPYSLTAQAITDADVLHIPPETFLQLMRDRPELCREATEMLGREVTFIQSALAERRKQASSRKLFADELAVGS